MKIAVIMLSLVMWECGEVAMFAQEDTLRGSGAVEFLPILSYDTDAGFGYGAKIFALNPLGSDESFDVTFFNSTKGERWYRLVFSRPDFERRHGTAYPFAVDVVLDYDKWIANSFFGIGNRSRYEDRELYTREPLELSITAGRGVTAHLVGQVGVRYRMVRNFNFAASSRLALLQPRTNSSRISYASAFLLLRYDTRNSWVNPSSGIVLSGEWENAPGFGLNDVSFTRIAFWYHSYVALSLRSCVFATRLGIQGLNGSGLPVQILLPMGGNNTLRGSPQDRFLDKVAAVGNIEIRFPLVWRFGGVAGFDAGKVWADAREVDLKNWTTNSVVGLRFYLDTFVVRFDAGFDRETTGFYLNFGQLF